MKLYMPFLMASVIVSRVSACPGERASSPTYTRPKCTSKAMGNWQNASDKSVTVWVQEYVLMWKCANNNGFSSIKRFSFVPLALQQPWRRQQLPRLRPRWHLRLQRLLQLSAHPLQTGALSQARA